MKFPKYILQIGFAEYAVPSSDGVATLMKLLADAISVNHDVLKNTLELQWADEGEEYMLTHATTVSVKRIPPGAVFTRKRKNGTVEILRPVPIADKRKVPAAGPARLNGRKPLQLEFGT